MCNATLVTWCFDTNIIAQSGVQMCYEFYTNVVHGGEKCKRSDCVLPLRFIQSEYFNLISLRQRLKLRSDSLSLRGVKSGGMIILQAVGICNLFVEEDAVG